MMQCAGGVIVPDKFEGETMSKQPRFSHPMYGLLPTEIEGFDSVAELVHTMSNASPPRNLASSSRAVFNAASARPPRRCGLDGLPTNRSAASSQAWRAAGAESA